MKYANLFHDIKCKINQKNSFVDASPQFHLLFRVLPLFSKIYTKYEMSKLKFIVTLREPVSREYSYFTFFTKIALAQGKHFSKITTFQNHTRNSTDHFLIYYRGLSEFVKYFSRDQILIIADNFLFKNSSDAMYIISKFLNIPFINDWSKFNLLFYLLYKTYFLIYYYIEKKFPLDDHMDHPRFKNIKECCTTFVPKLECEFRNKIGKFFDIQNELLFRWINETKINASKFEPIFPKFDSYTNNKCSNNSYNEFMEIIKNQTKLACTKKNSK